MNTQQQKAAEVHDVNFFIRFFKKIPASKFIRYKFVGKKDPTKHCARGFCGTTEPCHPTQLDKELLSIAPWVAEVNNSPGYKAGFSTSSRSIKVRVLQYLNWIKNNGKHV